MKFGAMNFPVLDVLDELEKIKSLEFDYMELAMDPPNAHHTTIRLMQKDLEKALKRHGLDIVCHLPTFIFTADLTPGIRKASLNEIIRSMETAKLIGAQKAVLHPCMATGMARFVPDQVKANAMESLSRIVAKAQNLDLKLCFENLFPQFGSFFEPEEFTPLFEQFPSLYMTLDIAHAHMMDKTGKRIFTFFEQFRNRIDHLHISDNKGKTDDHLPLGKGNVPVEQFAQAVTAAGYDGTITFEVFSDDTADIVGSREKFKRML